MKHLVIFAHPYEKSFGKGIVETIETATIESGSEIKIRDLYELGFDPILKGSDLLNLQSGNFAEDIKKEQEYVNWADLITFVYPVWWAGLPALLKGYVDRVFCNGFAFTNGENGPIGLLKGKKAMLFSTTGFPSELYDQIGMHHSMKQTSDEAIFEFCGIEVLNHTFFGAIPLSTTEDREKYLRKVSEIVKSNC